VFIWNQGAVDRKSWRNTASDDELFKTPKSESFCYVSVCLVVLPSPQTLTVIITAMVNPLIRFAPGFPRNSQRASKLVRGSEVVRNPIHLKTYLS
jgi:hypothetical protein